MTRPEPSPPELEHAFAELSRTSVADTDLPPLLERFTALTARVLPGGTVASVTVVRDGRARTVSARGSLAVELDEVQYRLGAGPCLTAAATGEVVEVPDTAADRRWPEFTRRAAQRGCPTVISVPLPGRRHVEGSLNVYAHGDRWDDRARSRGVRLAGSAAVAVSNRYLYAAAVDRAEQLQVALGSRGIIDQAKGILMERHKLTADRAFEVLTRISMRTNTKVRDIAEHLVRTGELPSQPG